MIDASLIVSAAALIFTVGSFYWLQARKGQMRAQKVSTFSGAIRPDGVFLRLPIMIYNTGAKPRVVSGLRLRFCGGEQEVLECQTFRTGLEAKTGDTQDFFHPYVVPGRGIDTKFAQFQGRYLPHRFGDEPTFFDIEVQCEGSPKWKAIGRVEVHTEIMHTAIYITYSNNPGVWTENILKDAKAWRAELAAKAGAVAPPQGEEGDARG